jgi:ABC-2 type transport system permease protein
MTWADIAGKDFRDAIRSPWLTRLTVLYVVAFPAWIVGVFYLQWIPLPDAANLTNDVSTIFIVGYRGISEWIIPAIAIVMAYAAITDERDSGSIKVLLSLPHSRRDLVLGKVVGRSGVVIVPIVVGLVVAILFLYGTGQPLVLGDFLFFCAMTLLLGIVFTALSVGLSAFMGSNRRAIFASVGIYLLFVLLWNDLMGGSVALFRWVLNTAFDTTLTVKQVFDIEESIKLMNPVGAYKDVVGIQVLGGGIARQFYATNNYGPVPFYLTHKFSILMMFLWALLPTGLGIWKLERSDL